jgi:anti-sigma-K factor RskA
VTDHHDGTLHPNLADALDQRDPSAADLDAIARRLADLGPDASIPAPPGDLLARIEAELAQDAVAEDALSEDVDVVPLRRARRLPLVVLGAAAAVVALVVGVVVLSDDSPATTTEQVALEALPGFEGASGEATLVVEGSSRAVTVDLAAVDVPAGNHLELWLLDDDVAELVPLGTIAGDGAHQLPEDADLDATPVVDISLEPDDGDPAHSGVSVVRGRLEGT